MSSQNNFSRVSASKEAIKALSKLPRVWEAENSRFTELLTRGLTHLEVAQRNAIGRTSQDLEPSP